MRKKLLALIFAAALLVAMAVPLFGGAGVAFAHVPPDTGPGGQDACVSDTDHQDIEDGLEVASDALTQDCDGIF